jgi:sugar O-acyltransferase (sialic acid O-acetyltransferase NeuD family)
MNDLLIIGAGGFGREVLQWIKDINKLKPTWNILGFIDDNLNALDNLECDYKVIGTINDWKPKENERFVMAVANPKAKQEIVKNMKLKGAVFTSIVHPSASISAFAQIGEGMIMYPNSLITVNTKVGDFVTLLSSSIGHDVEIDDYCTISSFCDITGGVKLGKRVFLGSHSTIIPKRKIGDDVYIAAGSVVMTNLKTGMRVYGNPAQKMDF